ncbi:MAG: PAS domain S-box protein [Synechococcales cyanobacterium M58_A2018_015]|nr:PAS domain S-box protein [Synechococcales cyanobacterium M58_A2018_015]
MGIMMGLWGGHSQMHQRLQHWDGSHTPLGSVDSWSPELRSLVRFCLDAAQPMELWWGAELAWIGNDAYCCLGIAPSQELGQSAYMGDSQRWAELGPLLEHVQTTGQALQVTHERLLHRNGQTLTTYWHCIYTPIRAEDGTLAGIACTYQDITDAVSSQRRWQMLQQVSARLAVATAPSDVVAAAETALAALRQPDLSGQTKGRILLYGIDWQRQQAYLLAGQNPAAQTSPWIDLNAANGLAAAVHTRQPQQHLWFERGSCSESSSESSPSSELAILLPLASPNQPVCGVLVVGCSSLEEAPNWVDEFEEWLAPQLALALDRVVPAVSESLLPLYTQMVNQLPLGIVVWRLDDPRNPGSFRLLLANPAASQATGVDFAALIHTTMAEDFPALLQSPLIEHYLAVVQSGQPRDLGNVLYGEDGVTQGVYTLNAFALPDRCLGLVFENITARKQMEAALHESEARYRLLTETVPSLIWTCDIDGTCDYVNPSYQEFTGRPLEQALGNGWLAILHPDDQTRCWESWQHAVATGEPYEVEVRYEHRSGSYRWILARGLPLYDEAGNRIKWVGASTDIHERKQRELDACFLADLSECIRRSEDVEAVLATVAPLVGQHLQVSRCFFSEVDQAHNRAVITHDYHQGVPSLVSELRLTDFDPDDIATLSAGQTIVNRDTQHEPRTRAFYTTVYRSLRVGAFIAVPLLRQGVWIFALCVSVETARDWSSEEIALLEVVAERVWLAIEKLRLDAALQSSETRYRMLVEAVPQMMWINDAAGNAEYFNARCQDYTGRTAAQRQGIDWQHDLHPDDLAGVIALRSQAIAQGEAYEIECRLRRVDQVYRWHLARVVPLKNETGAILCWFGTATDIHDLKQAEVGQRLLAQASSVLVSSLEVQATLSSIVQLVVPTLADCCVLDLLTADGKINRVGWQHRDPAQREWFGQVQQFASAPNRPQHPMQQAIRSSRPVLIPDVTDALLQQIATSPEHLRFLRGCEPASLLVVPLVARQRKLGLLHLCFTRSSLRRYTEADVTLAEELAYRMALALDNAQLYQQAQDANRLKDEFLAVLSHELRSPLNPILGWTKLLQSRQFDAQTTARALNTIERNVKLQAQLIEDLLDVSRILRGKLALTVAPVNLITTIEAALDTVRLAADAKSITLQMQLDARVGRVAGDANRLQQVFWNLFSNAVKFTPAGGRVEVRLEAVENRESGIGKNNSPSYAQITVSDTGKGIRRDFLPYVFDCFRQEDGKTTRQYGGLGLGLAIVRSLTELHGGTVQAESAGEGQGATFIVRLPLLPANRNPVSADAPVPAVAEPLALTGLRVLVVDDEADMRELMAVLLEQQGASVSLAASATEAMQQVQQALPDLLISDIGMPDVDGYMLLQQLRRSLSAEQLPAIALTAYAGEADQQQARTVGFQQHLAKPVDPAELVATILSLIQPCNP